MRKQIDAKVIHFVNGFDYGILNPVMADQIRTSAKRIRAKIKRTLVDIIDVGHDLLKVKDNLGHGYFGRWLLMEFGWVDRTARNFMAVAEMFGTKMEMISDLAIEPTAAYLLAAPSVTFEARQAAIERAKSGEKITAKIAKEILGSARQTEPRRSPTEKKWKRFMKVLDRFREQCDTMDLSELARKLRVVAKKIDKGKPESSAGIKE